MGFDVIKERVVNSRFFDDLLLKLDILVQTYFPNPFNYGVKCIIDKEQGQFYYELKPYNERLDEFVFSEMKRAGLPWYTYNNRIWILEN